MTAMASTSYGATVIETANQTGVNAEAVASIGNAESKFQNVATANGTSSATGPWQIVTGTFLGTSQKYGLGYTAADITNPQAQAVEAGGNVDVEVALERLHSVDQGCEVGG